MPNVFVVLPAYNEETALRRLIPDIAAVMASTARPWEIVLVDDGSSDGTRVMDASFPAGIPIHLLRHPQNRGYGAALATGYDWALKKAQPDDAIVSLDADNTHRPQEIPMLLKKLDDGFDVVTASYRISGGRATGVPFNRKIFSIGVNLLFSLRFRIPGAGTYSNGFRAYRASALQRTKDKYGGRLIEASGFAGGTELFLKVCRQGGRAAEIPSELHYENRGAGSKIRIGRTIAGYLGLMMQR